MIDLSENIYQHGEFFKHELLEKIRHRFEHIEDDPCHSGKRLFFENGGGALRLKKALEYFVEADSYPDCPERTDASGLRLEKIWKDGIESARIILNAKSGSIATDISASQCMFNMTHTVIENIPGNNVVVTSGDHPSAYDSAAFYCKKFDKEMRIAKCNPKTGASDVDEIIRLIDNNTCLLSFIYASNITGATLEAEEIIKKAREKKPDLFVILDAVQYAPHGVIDVDALGIDGINFAPYKFSSTRGLGIAYVSDRLSILPHDRYSATPENYWENGSPAPGLFAGITAIEEHVRWIGSNYSQSKNRRELFVEGMSRIKLHERALLDRILNGTKDICGLRHIPGVTLYLDIKDFTKRELLVGMGFDHLSIKDSAKVYEQHGIVTFPRTNDSMFSKRVLDSFGIEGLLRVTPMHCHSPEDIDYFLSTTKSIAKNKEIPAT